MEWGGRHRTAETPGRYMRTDLTLRYTRGYEEHSRTSQIFALPRDRCDRPFPPGLRTTERGNVNGGLPPPSPRRGDSPSPDRTSSSPPGNRREELPEPAARSVRPEGAVCGRRGLPVGTGCGSRGPCGRPGARSTGREQGDGLQRVARARTIARHDAPKEYRVPN